jgi:hypothetical protein
LFVVVCSCRRFVFVVVATVSCLLGNRAHYSLCRGSKAVRVRVSAEEPCALRVARENANVVCTARGKTRKDHVGRCGGNASTVEASEVLLLVVRDQMPRIPFHGVPCTGTVAAPFDCPSETGDPLPSSRGGTDITEYLISYNEKKDFTGFDGGSVTTTSTNVVLTGLTSRRTYYIRVLARNAQGAGLFCAHTDTNCLTTSTETVVSAVAK